MIWHEVAAGVTRVDWVKIAEFFSDLLYYLDRDLALFGYLISIADAEQDIVKERVVDAVVA